MFAFPPPPPRNLEPANFTRYPHSSLSKRYDPYEFLSVSVETMQGSSDASSQNTLRASTGGNSPENSGRTNPARPAKRARPRHQQETIKRRSDYGTTSRNRFGDIF